MANSYLENLTDEERAAIREKSKISKQERKEWAERNLKLSWLDEPLWRELSKKYNVKLPIRYHKAESKYVNRFLKQMNLDKEWYVSHSGFVNGNKEAEANPTMPAFAQVGLLLECYDDDKMRGIV